VAQRLIASVLPDALAEAARDAFGHLVTPRLSPAKKSAPGRPRGASDDLALHTSPSSCTLPARRLLPGSSDGTS
jgi:hypothetical protein